MFSPEILDRIHADHARDQAEAKRAALSSDGIFERIEVGAENHKVSDEPFRQCITNSFLFGTGKKARASAAVLFFGFAALASASVDPSCPSAFGPFGSSAPAGDRVVCLIDHDAPSQYELWSALPATKLSQTIVGKPVTFGTKEEVYKGEAKVKCAWLGKPKGPTSATLEGSVAAMFRGEAAPAAKAEKKAPGDPSILDDDDSVPF